VEETSSVSEWLEEIQYRNDDAAIKLWNRYFERLAALARNKLSGRPLRVVDESDVINQVFDDLLSGIQDGKFQRLDRDDLWALLITITERRCTDEIRRWNRQKRGGGAVRGDSAVGGRSGIAFDRFAIEPSHEFSLESRENLERLVGMLPTDSHRDVALMKLKGYTNQEIADDLGVSVPTVERRLRDTRTVWLDEPS
jgi:RNA polymerase sigma factor (sigma-70 family)